MSLLWLERERALGLFFLLRNTRKCGIIVVTLMKEFQHEKIIRLFYSVYY